MLNNNRGRRFFLNDQVKYASQTFITMRLKTDLQKLNISFSSFTTTIMKQIKTKPRAPCRSACNTDRINLLNLDFHSCICRQTPEPSSEVSLNPFCTSESFPRCNTTPSHAPPYRLSGGISSGEVAGNGNMKLVAKSSVENLRLLVVCTEDADLSLNIFTSAHQVFADKWVTSVQTSGNPVILFGTSQSLLDRESTFFPRYW